MLKGNAIIGQSGGPTAVINNSLVGVRLTNAHYNRIFWNTISIIIMG